MFHYQYFQIRRRYDGSGNGVNINGYEVRKLVRGGIRACQGGVRLRNTATPPLCRPGLPLWTSGGGGQFSPMTKDPSVALLAAHEC